MYIALMGCAQQGAGASTPLSASNSGDSGLTIEGVAGQPAASSDAGTLSISVTASGGTAPYRYSWVAEDVDDGGIASISSGTGTSTSATYNTLVIDISAMPNVEEVGEVDVVYSATCTVTDNTGATTTTVGTFTITLLGFPE